MGKGGGSSQPTQQVVQTKLPEWVDKASEENYNYAKSIADRPYTAYTGKTLADTPEDTARAYEMFRSGIGATDAARSQAGQAFSNAAAGIAGMDRSKYLNPYIDEVESKALSALDKQRTMALMANSDSARAAKAFGGSRHGVVDAVTNAESIEKAGLLSADLRRQGFDASSALMQSDIDNMLRGGQGILANAEGIDAQRARDVAGLFSSGTQQQAAEQAKLDDARMKWEDADNYPLEQLNIRLSALGMSPYGKTETSTGQQFFNKSSPDYLSAGLGAASLAMGLFSDEKAKTDITKVGRDPDTGIQLYAYRYKGDPKSYPKVVGPMADDVEIRFPGSTKKVGGKRIVKVV